MYELFRSIKATDVVFQTFHHSTSANNSVSSFIFDNCKLDSLVRFKCEQVKCKGIVGYKMENRSSSLSNRI